MTQRTTLPTRRPADTTTIQFAGRDYAVTIGTYQDGRPGEVFISGPKIGSDMEAVLDDGAVLVSLLLQHGVEPVDLAKTIGRVNLLGSAASILGAVVDLLVEAAADGRAA